MVMNMIEWARKTRDGTVEYSENGKIIHCGRSFCSWLNQKCVEHLSTLAGRISAVRTRFRHTRLTPIPISGELLFIPLKGLRSADCLLVNHKALTGWKRTEDNHLIISFSSSLTLEVQSKRILLKQCEKAKAITDYLNDRTG